MIVDLILDKAFRRAEINAKSIKECNKLIQAKRREMVRIETVKNIVLAELDKLILRIPKETEIKEFYRELLEITFDWKEIRKALIRVRFMKRIINKLYNSYKNSIKITRDFHKMKNLRREFYGRIASVLRRNKRYLVLLTDVTRFIRNIPNIKPGPTVVIAGYPNVGKSTLLYRLTGSKPEIQPYPFTTKNIMIGYVKTPYFNIQIIDTPGILDRPFESMNLIEKKAVLALRRLPHLIIYVVDATETCGYDLESQIRLLSQIEKKFEKEIWVYLSKTDLFKEEDYSRAKTIYKLEKPIYSDAKTLRDSLIMYFKKRKDLYL